MFRKVLLIPTLTIGLIVMLALPAQAASPSYSFGFKKSRDGQMPSIAQEPFQALLPKYEAIFLGNTSEKVLYLTFDNGYENGYTPQFLDILKDKKVPAVFFITGHYVKDQPQLVQRMVKEGHLIGNHSWSHPDMSTLSAEQIQSELDRVEEQVVQLTGQLNVQYLRPPRGIFNERTLEVSKELGYTNVFWSVAYADWDTKKQKGAQYAIDNVTKQLHPGAVILLHTVSKDNADALGQIIDFAREQGYEFKRLDQLSDKQYN